MNRFLAHEKELGSFLDAKHLCIIGRESGFKTNLFELIKKKGKSLLSIERDLGISKQRLYMIRREQNAPSVVFALLLAEYLDVEVEDIFQLTDESRKKPYRDLEGQPLYLHSLDLKMVGKTERVNSEKRNGAYYDLELELFVKKPAFDRQLEKFLKKEERRCLVSLLLDLIVADNEEEQESSSSDATDLSERALKQIEIENIVNRGKLITQEEYELINWVIDQHGEILPVQTKGMAKNGLIFDILKKVFEMKVVPVFIPLAEKMNMYGGEN